VPDPPLPGLAEEAILLQRAQSGDRDAFWELVAPAAEPIFRLALRMVRNRDDAEDVLQETMLQALDHVGEFRGGSRLTTWLHRIAVNRALTKLRRRRNDVFSIDDPPLNEDSPKRELIDWSISPLDELVAVEAQSALEEAIESLPIDLRTVLVLRDLNGLTNEEAASALELPLGAVKWRIGRARETMREQLEAYFRGKNWPMRPGSRS